MSVVVVDPGRLCLVEDGGRPGYGALGIAPSGAFDVLALRAANAIVGNPPGTAGIEFTLKGPTLRFEADHVCALTGSRFEAQLDGAAVSFAETFEAPAGSTLAIGRTLEGARAWLAIRGGIATKPFLGSRSGQAGSPLGPQPLKADVRLPAGARERVATAPATWISRWAPAMTLRAIPSGLDAPELFEASFTVNPSSTRIGLLLDEAIPIEASSDAMPSGTVLGAVQVPADGRPIILGPERPTTGGYAIAAYVIAADVGLLAQAKPSDTLRFGRVTLDEARRAWDGMLENPG